MSVLLIPGSILLFCIRNPVWGSLLRLYRYSHVCFTNAKRFGGSVLVWHWGRTHDSFIIELQRQQCQYIPKLVAKNFWEAWLWLLKTSYMQRDLLSSLHMLLSHILSMVYSKRYILIMRSPLVAEKFIVETVSLEQYRLKFLLVLVQLSKGYFGIWKKNFVLWSIQSWAGHMIPTFCSVFHPWIHLILPMD